MIFDAFNFDSTYLTSLVAFTVSGPVDETNGLALKRKLCLEDAIPFKRPRTDEVVPGKRKFLDFMILCSL